MESNHSNTDIKQNTSRKMWNKVATYKLEDDKTRKKYQEEQTGVNLIDLEMMTKSC